MPNTELYFSSYNEGSSADFWLEIYNPTNSTISLADYALGKVTNGGTGTYQYWIPFTTSSMYMDGMAGASILAREYWLLARVTADETPIVNNRDQSFNASLTSGNDGVKLLKKVPGSTKWGNELSVDPPYNPQPPPVEGEDFTVLDCLGDWQADPGSGWAVAGVADATKNHTLVRKTSVTSGNSDWTAAAGTTTENSEWIVMDKDSFTQINTYQSEVANNAPTGSVIIAGIEAKGNVLTVSNDLDDGDGPDPLIISYQWNRDGVAIEGETAATYTLVQADVGSIITVTASYTDDLNVIESVTSDPTGIIVLFQPQSKSELSTAVALWISDNASALSTYGEINTWDTSEITDMSLLFYQHPTPLNFNSDIGNWNTSKVTTMYAMFYNCLNWNQDISQKEVSAEDSSTGIAYTAWDTGEVNNMNQMFGSHNYFNNGEAAGLSNKPLNWNTSKVTNMYKMFYYAQYFNQDIGNWNTSEVTSLNQMFDSADAFNQDISQKEISAADSPTGIAYTAWDTGKVTLMYRMFGYNDIFNNGEASGLSNKPLNWNTSNVTSMSQTFNNAPAFNQDIGNWDTSKVTTMYAMFYYAYSFNQDISQKEISAADSLTGVAYTAWNTPVLTTLSYILYAATEFNNDSFGQLGSN